MNTSNSDFPPEWNQLTYNKGAAEWELSAHSEWLGKGTIEIRFYIDDPKSEVSKANFQSIITNWKFVWSRITNRTEELMEAYEHTSSEVDLSDDYFYLRIPIKSIEEGADWSVMLQSMVGWLLDFEGWKDSSEQAVF